MKSTTRAVVGGHFLGGRVVVRLVPTGLGDLTLAGPADYTPNHLHYGRLLGVNYAPEHRHPCRFPGTWPEELANERFNTEGPGP